MSLPALLRAARPVLPPFVAMGLLWGTFAAVLPDTMSMLGVNEAQIGLLMLAAPVAAVTAMFAAPGIGALLGRVALPVASLTMALAFAMPGQSPGLIGFALAMAGCGATTGALDVLMNARVAAIENDRNIHLMNLCHAAYSFGFAAGALGTGAARTAGWAPGSVFLVAAAAAAIVGFGSFEREGRIAGLRRPPGGATSLGPVPLIGGAVVLIAFLSENAAESWSALHIERTLGGSAAEGSSGPAVMALTMAASRLIGQGIIARVSPIALLNWGAILAAFGAAVAAFALSPGMAYGGFIVMGIGASVIAPTAFSLVGRLAAPDARARAVARATMLGYCGYFFGPPALGFLATAFGLRVAFGVAALALLCIVGLAAVLSKQPGAKSGRT